jgi:hypothetical protein
VCYRHGTKILCSSEGCPNHALKGGVLLGMEQKSNDVAVMDAPIQLKSTRIAVRRINNILCYLSTMVALINNKE